MLAISGNNFRSRDQRWVSLPHPFSHFAARHCASRDGSLAPQSWRQSDINAR